MSTEIKFEKNKKFLDDKFALGLSITADKDPEVAAALASDQPFPQRDVELGNISVSGEAGKDVKFNVTRGGTVKGSVSFKATASAHAGMGIYFDPAKLLAALELDKQKELAVSLEKDPNFYFLTINWGYDLAETIKGSVALGGPGAINFAQDGSRNAAYAVVRRLPKNEGALTAVKETANSWMMPTQATSIDDFEPGTWLVAEVSGSFGIKLEATYGYDLSWVRATKLGGLTGNIGTKIQLGLGASLGFNASGQYALVMSRDSLKPEDKVLRLRLFKKRKNGLDVAFNAGAVFEPIDTVIGDKTFDEFIAGVFGAHGTQVVDVLKRIDQWTDPNQPLPEVFAGLAVGHLQDFLMSVTQIQDFITEFNHARELVLHFTGLWDDLDHRVASLLWKMVEEKIDFAPISDVAGRIVHLDQSQLRSLFDELLPHADFFQTPVGRWLEAAAAGGLMNLLNDSQAFADLQKAAELTGKILDGSELQKVLTNLHKFVEDHFASGITFLRELNHAVTDADLAHLDDWLKHRLEAFLEQKLDIARLEEIRQAIHELSDKRNQFFDAARKALHHKYEFHFNATYARTTTDTALLDLELQFQDATQGGAAQHNQEVASFLSAAIDGNFDKLLVERHDGVVLKNAALSHGVQRHSHVEVSMPFFNTATDHINNTLASASVRDNEAQILYDLKADDIVSVRNKSVSRLAIALGWQQNVGGQANSVQIFSPPASYSYSYKQVKMGMKNADLVEQFSPLINKYFRRVFGPESGGAVTFPVWVSNTDIAIDQAIDKLNHVAPGTIIGNGRGNFGDTLVSLELTLPARVPTAWLKAHEDENDNSYMRMSLRLQDRLKELIRFEYFSDLSRFQNFDRSRALLVYLSLPPTTSVKRAANGSLQFNTDEDIYWDWRDTTVNRFRQGVLNHSVTQNRLVSLLQNTHDLLVEHGLPAGNYDPARPQDFTNPALNQSSIVFTLLNNLLLTEEAIVNGARDAGVALAQALKNAPTKPSAAIKKLADFGSNATATFNAKLDSVFLGSASRSLGAMLFAEAASVLDPDMQFAEPDALLKLTVLKDDATFKPSTFLDGETPSAQDVLFQQPIVN
ncbi:MAG TPA: hypothetical protein VGC91_14440 [Pyrinomonadaceae bacterium]